MASTSSEAPPSSPRETPTINNSTESKPLENADPKGKKPLENNHYKDDNHGGALSLSSEMIHKDLHPLDLAQLSLSKSMGVSTSSEAPPSSPTKTPTINKSSTKTKSKCSIRSLVDNLAKFFATKPKPLENNPHNAASSSGITNEDDNHGGALSHSYEMIQKDLLLLESALTKYMDHTNEKINQAREKFKKLPKLASSEGVFDEVRKSITKLKGQIPSHHSSDSKSQPREWPNINGVEKEMMHFFYEEQEVNRAGDLEGPSEAFLELPKPFQYCLLCFFKFPTKAFIRRTTMIYLWIVQGYVSLHLQNTEEYPQEGEELPLEENVAKKIFDELIAKNFIERCSKVPNSCRLSLSVRPSLYKEAKALGFTSNGALDQNIANVRGCLAGNSCLINIGKAIINNELTRFENVENIQSLHLGRWQSSANHHIELEEKKILSKKSNILDELKKLKRLKFLSLRGISMITELPTSILELNDLKILDLGACQNLEVIPTNISLLKNLTHLDMSECYFLEHMPKSLAQLSNLEVLKGFFIGHVNKKQSCTLHDLSKELPKLRKLNIYTSDKEFPTSSDLNALGNFEGLLKLTISWGGCSLQVDGRTAALKRVAPRAEGLQTFHPRLQKLDLQGFPMQSLPHWLQPANLKELKKLYIRGGNLCDLGQLQEHPGEQWKVEILRLKYLSELEIDGDKLRSLFPELIYLHQLKCPKLTSFQVDKSGVWMDEKAIDTRIWLQKFFKTDGISLSSLVGLYCVSKRKVWEKLFNSVTVCFNSVQAFEKPEVKQMHFFSEKPEVKCDLEDAFLKLPEPWRCCLLCFFKFPPEAFIKRKTMIYLWIGQGYISKHLSPKEKELLPPEEDAGKKILDELIAKNFIERCSSEKNSCRMSCSYRSSLCQIAQRYGFTSINEALDHLNLGDCYGYLAGNSCLINVGKAIIDWKLVMFENVKNIRSLHLGRWQSSAKHHIELEDVKIFDGLKKLKSLTFLSLRGIPLITELPTLILELNDLKILDLRACHNLEAIPKNIGLLKNLTHLDMSKCYFLEHMPESLAQLSNLEVLKGFFIGHVKNKTQSCNLHDLSTLEKLRKLNIYTSVKEFPTMSDLDDLRNFKGLIKLTISWGGCSLKDEKNDSMTTDSGAEGLQTLHLRLQKLDLQGFPMKSLPRWLRPANLKELKKLYIRGGNLCDLGQLQERPGEQWKVEILRLKYLSELEIDGDKLRSLFPELIYLHQLKCPKLTSFQVDKSGVWMDEKAIDTRIWLQKFFKTDGFSLSSLVGYGPNLSQDDSNVCPVD